jgi:hypothetical protein
MSSMMKVAAQYLAAALNFPYLNNRTAILLLPKPIETLGKRSLVQCQAELFIYFIV